MEPHQIPQNVTTFQFRLVGDMTLKQFGYLATGATIAYLVFVFLSPEYPLIAWPLIIIFASLGAAFAFLPIGSRPLDYWLGAFLKAVYSPTKRVWQKNGKKYPEDPLFKSRYIMYVSSLQPIRSEDTRTTQRLDVADKLEYRPSQTPPPISDLPTQEELQKTVELARQAQALQIKIIQTERELNQIKTEAGRPTPIPVDYSQQVNNILADLQKLMTQASQVKNQLDSLTNPPQTKPQLAPPPLPKEKIKVVVSQKPKQTQVALTTFPNVLNGIINDVQGNYLDGVIAVIYDKEGLPVRALKTNKLGQFSGSTPLPNGVYTLELEKEGFSFDVLQIELDGQVLPPLLVTAKGAAT